MLATAVSLQVAICTCVIATPVGVAAAYALFVYPGKATRVVYTALMMPLMVPHIIAAIGIFFVYARFGMNNSVTRHRARAYDACHSVRPDYDIVGAAGL
jgi:putative spermidine/putrescine transport system permease protein